MVLCLSISVIILLCLQVDGELFPQGHQWKYSYYALLRSGTLLPAEAYSQWDMRALLTITAVDNVVLAQLDNFNSSLYNGLRDGIPQDLKPSPIPDDAANITMPFLINYEGTNVVSISVSEDDALWSVNIKRAIASILQVNLEKLNTPASYISEHNIYGNCDEIEYSVVNNTEYVYVRKVIDHLKCRNFPVRDWSSVTQFPCSDVGEDPYSASTTREYTLADNDGDFELKHVLSSRRLYVQPFQAYGEVQQTYQYQSYGLLGTSAITENITTPTNLVKKSLTYELTNQELSHGRSKSVVQIDLINYIDMVLDDVVNNLEEQRLEQNITKLHQQELPMLYYNSFLLNLESLQQLYADIAIGTSYHQETKRNLFLELLPQIGTDASVNFMKELIMKRELKDLIGIKMLSMYPFYVRYHSNTLLTDMEALLSLGDNYDKSVRHTAILSFATLVFQTYTAGEITLEQFEDYALKYFNWFSESNTYEKRMLYLQGLNNLQLGSVTSYLSSIIQNNEQSRHIRFLAIWAAFYTAPTKPQQVYEDNWPILTDRAQHLEMRVSAFNILLYAEPTRSRLLTLFWYMQGETDPHLYNFFYTTLVSLQNTQYPCYKHLGKLVAHFTRFLRAPRNNQQWMTGNYIVDYANTERAFGAIVQLLVIGNPVTNSPNVVFLTLNSYATGKNLNQVSVYLKLQGVADHVREAFNTETNDKIKIEKLIKLLEQSNLKLIAPEEIHIELIVSVQGKSVFSYHIDGRNFKKSSNALTNLKMLLEYHVNYQSIVLPYIREHIEPSDVGTLVIRGIVSNSIASTRGNFFTQATNQLHTHNLEVDFRYYTYTTSFLELYNPMSNTWNGVHKSKSIQGRFLFNGTLNIDMDKSLVELSEVRTNNEYFGVLLHSQILTYIMGNGSQPNALHYHCPTCTNAFIVNGDMKKTNENILNIPFENFGNRFQISVFDCEKYQDIKRLLLDTYSSHYSNTQILPLLRPVMYAIHVVDYITYIPSQGSCGISINLKPLYLEPTELKITFNAPHSVNLATNTSEDESNEIVHILTLRHRKIPDGPSLQFWNATSITFLKPDKRYMNISLTIEHVNAAEEHQKLCLTTELNLPEIQADMFSIKASEPTVSTLKAVWGKHDDQNATICPENGASIEAVVTASVTDEQNEIVSLSSKWPYKHCRDSVADHKFTPISLPCYLASKEAATYRKYRSDMQFSNMPEWFISTAQKLQSVIGLLQKHSSQNDMIAKSSQITYVNTSLEFAAQESSVIIKLNSKEAVVDYSGFKFIETFLINPRFLLQDDWNINLGLSKVCLITPNYITTVDNRTIPVDEIKMRTKDTLIAADCTQNPKFAVLLDSSTNFEELAFTFYAGSDILNVKPNAQNISVTLNEAEYTTDTENMNINVRRLQDDVILAKSKYGGLGINIYYTKEYMVVTIPGFYTGKTCGICSSIKSNLP